MGRNMLQSFFESVQTVLEAPVVWVKETIVKPNQKNYPWYHQKFRRVPTIDQCYTDDVVCIFEADAQYRRDRLVDNNIVSILRRRFEECTIYERPDHVEKCHKLWEIYEQAATNWFIKYGDLGAYHNARSCYMKQKHRMLWERKYGPVGTGKKDKK